MGASRTMAEAPYPGPTCPRCGGLAPRSETPHGARYDCCGLRAWGEKPLATHGTLRARGMAHAAFDPIWQEGHLSRSQAYRRLAALLGLSRRVTHMSLFDEETAYRVPAAARAIMAEVGAAAGRVPDSGSGGIPAGAAPVRVAPHRDASGEPRLYRCKVEVRARGKVVGSERIHVAGLDEGQARTIAERAMRERDASAGDAAGRTYAVTAMLRTDRARIPAGEAIHEADPPGGPPCP